MGAPPTARGAGADDRSTLPRVNHTLPCLRGKDNHRGHGRGPGSEVGSIRTRADQRVGPRVCLYAIALDP